MNDEGEEGRQANDAAIVDPSITDKDEEGPPEGSNEATNREKDSTNGNESSEDEADDEDVVLTIHGTEAGNKEAAANGDSKVDREDKFSGLGLFEETLELHDLANYTFGKKDTESNSILSKNVSEAEIGTHLKKQYEKRGMRRSVAGLLLVHGHHFPHVLLLQKADGNGS